MSPIASDIPSNCIKQLMEERGLSNRDLAKAMDVSDSTVSRIVNSQVDITSKQMGVIARVLGVTFNDLFSQPQRKIETAGVFSQLGSRGSTQSDARKQYRFWLSADDPESRLWLWTGLADWNERETEQNDGEVGAELDPRYARVRLQPGRTLLGRAVEADGDYAHIPAAHRLVIARDASDYPQDTRLSRLHCDFTTAAAHDHVMLCVHGGRGVSVGGCLIEPGQTMALTHRSKLQFPNGATLHLDREGF